MTPGKAVHPHARGDNHQLEIGEGFPDGSPPRAWGQQLNVDWESARDRFTPTRVGTTLEKEISNRHTSVHPHARGDNVAGQNVVNGFGGSPPRAWGQHICTLSIIRLNRFTPTRVGTTHETSCWAEP